MLKRESIPPRENGLMMNMGGRIVAAGLADEIVALWLTTAFAGGRHQRRIDQISAAEKEK